MREIIVEPLARVEGEGGISIRMDGNKIKDVHFDIFEGTRLIETLVEGKTPAEDVSIACRICAICTISHRYAALRGLEKALGIAVPEKVQLLRSLMHLGELIESNSLHVFVLALPDFLGYPSAIAMAEKYGDEVLGALSLKKYGNHIMQVTGGRMIHGENPTVGGFGKFPDKKTLLGIKSEAKKQLAFAEIGSDLIGGLEIPDFFEEETTYMCCEPGDGTYGIVGDRIIISDGSVVDVAEYKSLTNEQFCAHSAAKHCLYNGKPYSVGALARMVNLGERLQGKAGVLFKKYYNPRWLKNPVFNNLAQAIELVWALELIPGIVDKMLKIEDDPEIVLPSQLDGEGVGAVEAPRGTLYHHYKMKDGLIDKANFVIPTGQNLEDVEKYMRNAVEALVKQDADDDKIRFQCEVIARAYDPCISCSTHLVKIER
ncbi:Ni/Fe hydrogenase subunit alpha [bacterium]|nr:Ni/Fe hydrogenase subunit alpha [bacterium]